MLLIFSILFFWALNIFFTSGSISDLEAPDRDKGLYGEDSYFIFDESVWVWNATYFRLFFKEKDFHNSLWHHYWAYDQPVIGKYLMGLALDFAGKGWESLNLPWRYDQNPQWNLAHHRHPRDSHLVCCRLFMAMFGALSCFLVYLLGLIFFDWFTGVGAAVLLASHPLFFMWTRKAMSDSPLLFFILLTVFVTVFLYRAWQHKRKGEFLFLSGVVGVCGGLSVGVKFSGMIAMAFIVNIFLYCLLRDTTVAQDKSYRSRLHWTALGLGVLLFFFILFFVLPNPTLYHRPLEGIQKMLEQRVSCGVHGILNRYPDLVMRSLSERLFFVLNAVFGKEIFIESLAVTRKVFYPELLIFIFALAVILSRETHRLKRREDISEQGIFLLWAAIFFAAMAFWIPLKFARYLLPLLPPAVLGVSFGTVYLLKALARGVCNRVRKKRR